MALGASAGDVVRAFLRHGLTLTTAGVAVGLVAAWFVAPWLPSWS